MAPKVDPDALSSLTYRVTFLEYKKPCPICGEYLDVITRAHTSKHALTREDFLATYAPYLIKDTDDIKAGKSAEVQVREAVANNPRARISAAGLSLSCKISVRSAQEVLRKLDAEGIVARKGAYYERK
jgi:predicted Rossmann fold nucleotide-binding protein DprA/Smf involved in DNA uptake